MTKQTWVHIIFVETVNCMLGHLVLPEFWPMATNNNKFELKLLDFLECIS